MVNSVDFSLIDSAQSTFQELDDLCVVYDAQLALVDVDVCIASLLYLGEKAPTNYEPDEWVHDILCLIDNFNV